MHLEQKSIAAVITASAAFVMGCANTLVGGRTDAPIPPVPDWGLPQPLSPTHQQQLERTQAALWGQSQLMADAQSHGPQLGRSI